jgi:phage pi2 protein 07
VYADSFPRISIKGRAGNGSLLQIPEKTAERWHFNFFNTLGLFFLSIAFSQGFVGWKANA